jgi:hypothetical protein
MILSKHALSGQEFGLTNKNITQLIICTRYQGYTLYPMTEWPSFVYVARILDETVLQTLSLENQQVEMIAWAAIFRTLKEARAYARVTGNDILFNPFHQKHPQEIRVPNVQFLSEQDGLSEQLLKDQLIDFFFSEIGAFTRLILRR